MVTLHIGFTGTRAGLTELQADALRTTLLGYDLTENRHIVFHHGDCIGADDIADEFARRLFVSYTIVLHPPIEDRYRAHCERRGVTEIRPQEQYLQRNHQIVDESKVLIATPGTFQEELRSGTWATVRYARKVGRIIRLIFPDGTQRLEKYEQNGQTV